MSGPTPHRQQILYQIALDTIKSPQALSLLLVTFLGALFGISFFSLPAMLWLLVGIVGVVAIFIANLNDAPFVATVFDRLTYERYDLTSIKNIRSRQRLEQALAYASGIKEAAHTAHGSMAMRLDITADQINDWVEHIYTLAKRIDIFEKDTLLRRDLARVPHELQTLQQRAQTETEPHIKKELETSIQLYQNQLEQLKRLELAIKRATIQLDNTLAALGTIYAQVQLLDVRQSDSGSIERLRQNIVHEISLLKDTIDSIDEVQQQSLHAMA